MENFSNFQVLPKHNRNKFILVALHAQNFPFTGESHGICALSGYIKTHYPEIDVDIYDLQISDMTDLLEAIIKNRPVILGISAKLQTFDQMQILYSRLKTTIPIDQMPILVMGNAIPNFNGQLILEEYYKDIIVARAEGEIVFDDLIAYIRGIKKLQETRNISFWDGDKIHVSPKDYLDGDFIPMPDRSNSWKFYELGGEVYLECSRGCAYGNCTFCSCSEFLGSKQKSKKWRARPIPHIIQDFKNLQAMGISNVTLADEDFFGIGIDNMLRIKHLAEEMIANEIQINIRLNAWVKSIYSVSDSKENLLIKEETIRLLKKAGLVKVFMGLESGVDSQLKRYLKGFVLDEFTNAFKMLKKYDIECEFGFILIDPLVSLHELKSSLAYLGDNNFIHEITSIYKELRVQVGNSYIYQVRALEIEHNIKLLDIFDFNTQGYKVLKYVEPEIQFFAVHVREWVNIFYKLYYILRIFTRYTEQSKNYISANRISRKICFDTINTVRELEYYLLKSFVTLIEVHGTNDSEAIRLLLEYEERRIIVIKKLISELEFEKDLLETQKLLEEAQDYLIISKSYVRNLLKPQNFKLQA